MSPPVSVARSIGAASEASAPGCSWVGDGDRRRQPAGEMADNSTMFSPGVSELTITAALRADRRVALLSVVQPAIGGQRHLGIMHLQAQLSCTSIGAMPSAGLTLTPPATISMNTPFAG